MRKKLKHESHIRGNNDRYRVKHGAFRFVNNVRHIEHDIFKRGDNIPLNEHIFCQYCGREITHFHVERARTICLHRHIRVTTTDDEFLYYCLPYEKCMDERKIGILSQGIKVLPKQYIGVNEHELQDLWK